MRSVLCILEDGFEEIELVVTVDILRRAGIEVLVAGISKVDVIGKCEIAVRADDLLEHADPSDFDCLFLPGGPAVNELRNNGEVLSLIQEFHNTKKEIAAICAAPLLLLDAGILEGKSYTAHFSTKDELPESTGNTTERSEKLLTARGAGVATEFALALVEILLDKDAANEVSEAIMA